MKRINCLLCLFLRKKHKINIKAWESEEESKLRHIRDKHPKLWKKYFEGEYKIRKPIGKFKYKCICWWSKDDKYGFIPNTECPAHGKQTRKLISKSVSVDKIKHAKKEK